MVALAENSHRGRCGGRSRRAGVSRGRKPKSRRGLSTPNLRPAEGHWYIDELILHINSGQKYYAHVNHLYSVEALTDSAGTVVERYRYDAYGAQKIYSGTGVARAASLFGQKSGFTGRYLDAETQLWFFRARYFDAVIGRFISRDPLEYVDGMSKYNAYFIPSELDPTGLCSYGDCEVVMVAKPSFSTRLTDTGLDALSLADLLSVLSGPTASAAAKIAGSLSSLGAYIGVKGIGVVTITYLAKECECKEYRLYCLDCIRWDWSDLVVKEHVAETTEESVGDTFDLKNAVPKPASFVPGTPSFKNFVDDYQKLLRKLDEKLLPLQVALAAIEAPKVLKGKACP